MKKLASILLALIITMMIGGVAFASDVSDADYYGVIRGTNNGTSVYDVSPVASISTPDLIDSDFLNSSANNCAVRISASDTAFMPGYSTNPWVIFYPFIAQNSNVDAVLYTGNVTGGKLRYFPDPSGNMTTSDSVSAELGDNFTVGLSGFFDTDNGSGKRLFYKEDAIDVSVSSTVAGNITANIIGSSVTTNLTLYADGAGDETSIPSVAGAATHWEAVSTLNDSTYVYHNTTTHYRDLYTVDDPDSVPELSRGDINSVTVNFRMSGGAVGNNGHCVPVFKIDGTSYNGTEQTQAIGYADKTQVFANNPITAVAWTWDDIEDMQLGEIIWHDFAAQIVSVSEMYITVNYEHMPLTSTTLLDVDSEEHDYIATADGYFFGSGIDNTANTTFPSSENLTLNLPLHHFEMNESTITSKDENEYTVSVDATWTEDGYQFDADGKKLTLSNPYNSLSNITVMAWYKRNGNSAGSVADNYHCLVSAINGYSPNRLLLGKYGDTLYIEFRTLTDTYQDAQTVSCETGWHLLGYVYNSVSKTFNHIVDGQVITGISANGTPRSSTSTMSIGIYTTNTYYSNGVEGDIILYDKALSESEIEEYYELTKWKYQDNVTEDFHYNYMGNTSVPDNSNDIASCEGGSVMYLEDQEITVNGTLVQHVEWEYDSVFHDSSGYGNDAYPDFRTSSSDPDVSAELISFEPLSLSSVSDDTSLTWPEIMEDAPEFPDTMYSENETPGFFFAGIVHALAVATDIPESLFWYNFAFTIIIGVGIIVFWIVSAKRSSANDHMGRLAIKVIAQAGVMCFFAIPGLNIYGFFVPLYYLLFSGGILIMAKDYGW